MEYPRQQFALATTLLGAAAAWVFFAGPLLTIIGGLAGIVIGLAFAQANVRPLVALSLLAGGLAGAWVGREIIRALCFPGSCTSLEIAGSIGNGVGAAVGLGLLIALVVRSFDEYRETAAKRAGGYETEPNTKDTL